MMSVSEIKCENCGEIISDEKYDFNELAGYDELSVYDNGDHTITCPKCNKETTFFTIVKSEFFS